MASFWRDMTWGAMVFPSSGAQPYDIGGATVSPPSGAVVSAPRGAVDPTSPGSSGSEAKRPNFRDKDMNAIHRAAKQGNRWRVKQLLFFGISDVNARDKMSRTALHVACAYGRTRMATLLIERRCQLDLSDIEKKTALIQALQYQNTKCATLLLDCGADPNIMDKDGNTALHYAVLGHNKAIVEKLISCKANIEVRNKSDLTPLALAKLANNEKMVELLVSRGAKDDQRKQQLTSENKKERRPRKSQWCSLVVYEMSTEDSLNSKQQLTSKYKEGKKPPKSESSNLATDVEESPKSPQTKTKSKTVDKISAEDPLNSNLQLPSEYEEGRTQTLESSHFATDLQESPKSVQTKTKSKTVDEISAEGSLKSNQQLTSEYEKGRTQALESSLLVEDISEEEDSLNSKQQLTSEYQERRRPHTSESTHRVLTDLRHTQKQAWAETKSKTVDEKSAEGYLNSKQQLTSEYEEGRTQTLERSIFVVEDISEEEDSLSSKQQLNSEYQERRPHKSGITHSVVTDLRHTQKQAWTETKSKTVDEISEKDCLSRLSSKSDIDDAWLTSHNEDFKDKVLSKTCILTAKTSENQIKQIHLQQLHLEKMSQESQINRACDKEDTSAYSGHPSVQKDEEMCIKQSTLEQRENLQLSKDESKQKSHEFSGKFKMTECPEEEPPRDNSKGGASLRQMHSNLTSKILDCEGKDAFRMSVSAALQTFPEREESTLKIVHPSHADPGSPEDSPSSSSELPLREKELHSENEHKPDTEHVLNTNEESFYNETENKKVRHPIVTSEAREDQEIAMQMTKNMNPNTRDWKLGIRPTPQTHDPKSHFDLRLVHCNETKPMTELKSHHMPAVTKTYTKIKPNQDLFQKPLCADNCSANYCKSTDSKLKDESSSALHNDRTPGVYVNEEDLQRLKNDVDMVKVESLAWKRKKIQLQKEVEVKMEQKNKREVSGNTHYDTDDSESGEWSQKSKSEQTDKQQVSIMEDADSYRLCSKTGIDDDSKPTSHNEDLKDKVISQTQTRTAKTSKNQSKLIRLATLHLEKMTQESQINRACGKEDRSAYLGHPSMQKDEEMCIKQGTLEQRKNLQLCKDESKQKSHEFSGKFKMTECPEEEPPRDNSKEGASLRQMPSNLTRKMLDCERKDAFGKSISAVLQTFPEREETTLKIVCPSHADPGFPEDSSWSSSSELSLREKELHSENDHKPDAEHVLNKNEESFYNDTESEKVRTPVVMSEMREDQEFAMQMTKNMNPNTTDWKLGMGPTPQSSDPKSHFDLWLVRGNESKPMIEIKKHDMPAITNTYKETKPNQDLFQKPLCAYHFSANYCKSLDSKLKEDHSSALHNDTIPGVNVIEELQQDLQTFKNDVDMVKEERLAWKKMIVQLQKEVEVKLEQKSSKRETSGNVCAGADDDSDSIGVSHQSNSEHTDNQHPSDDINENSVIFMNKVEVKMEQKSSKKEVSGNVHDGADDSDIGGWSQQSNSAQTDKQQVSIMEDADSYRFTLEEEKEERPKVDLLYEKNRVLLRNKEEHSIEEVETNPYFETTIRTQDVVSEAIRENKVIEEQNYTQSQLSQEQNARISQDGILTKHLCKPKEIEITHEKMNYKVSESSDKEKSLLHENRMLWEEIAKLRLEIDTLKNQTQEMGKKYFEDIAIVKEKNDCLEKTIREAVFQDNAQLEVLRAELIMLNSKLENEQQRRGRLEIEVESYQSRLAAAVQDHEHCQASERDLQLAFKRARDEWLCLWDKMNFDMSNLKHNNEILSQRLSKMESKSNNLEIELHHTSDALQERTLVLERVVSQKQCQQEGTEHVHQEEQGKVDKDIAKQKSLQEKLSHLQTINKLLRQQLDQAHNKADREGKTVINIQDQIQDKISIFNAESVKQITMLNDRINKLINEWHHFKERIHQYENDNVERDAIVRQLQEELAVVRQPQQKISMVEASLEVESCHPVHVQHKTRDFKKELDQSRSQNDELIEKLQPASSKCIDLDEEKTPQQQLAMEALLKECEELKNTAEKWEQETVNLRTHMETNMVESCEAEEYKKKIEERARQDVADNFKQVYSFLQTIRESQEKSEQMINKQASIRRPLELRNKELELELSRVQTSQDHSKLELEIHKLLYQEQLERRKRLENKVTDFHWTKERLAEVSTELLQKEQQNKLLLNAKMRPVLEAPSVGNLNTSFLPRRNSTRRENLDSPTSRSHTLYYQKMWREFEEILTREEKEDAANFETESYRASPVASIYQSSSTQDLLLKAQKEYKEILLKKYQI